MLTCRIGDIINLVRGSHFLNKPATELLCSFRRRINGHQLERASRFCLFCRDHFCLMELCNELLLDNNFGLH